MKTYTIKPLEWKKSQGWIFSGRYTIRQQKVFYELRYEEKGCVIFCDLLNLEAAKAKAQELHEAELMKYLQECHSLPHSDANLSVLD